MSNIRSTGTSLRHRRPHLATKKGLSRIWCLTLPLLSFGCFCAIVEILAVITAPTSATLPGVKTIHELMHHASSTTLSLVHQISHQVMHTALAQEDSYVHTAGKAASKRRYYFPLLGPPLLPFADGGRHFGASRDWGTRLHAGVDLVEYAGHPVFAVTDGKIIDYDYFYDGTDAVVVHHDTFIVRYGEVRQMYGNLQVGNTVSAGEKIALVGTFYSSGESMLHFEKFSGKLRGPLTHRGKPPYQRRSDLINPTGFIRSLEGSYSS